MKNKDVYQAITDRIIDGLKRGKIPWRKTWKGEAGMPKNFISKKQYRGANIIVLWFHMVKNGYSSPYYLTFKQVNKLGGKVKKGAKSELVIFWQWIRRDTGDTNPKTGEKIIRKFPLLKYYRVFNIEQTEGIEYEKTDVQIPEFKQIENAEKFVAGYKDKPNVQHGGARACYSPTEDRVQMPNPETFESEPAYYGTLFHELTHSTGHKDRLNRAEVTETDGFGGENYSREELTAEIGTAFICAITGISNEKLEENQQAYINGWISKLESDPKMIILASARAQKAVDYMQGKKQSQPEDGEEDTERTKSLKERAELNKIRERSGVTVCAGA
jgi:antirestriction protein ArdC